METASVIHSRDRAPASTARIHRESDYALLKGQIQALGLLKRAPAYYLCQGILAAGLVVLCISLLWTANHLALRLLTAALMAATAAQLGFLGHDLGHRQVFTRPLYNDLVMLLVSPLVGISPSWWIKTHNRHHGTPNDLERDPHSTIPVLAFSEGQAQTKKGIYRALIRRQAYYFLPLLCLSVLATKANGIVHLAKGRSTYPLAESVGFCLHVLLYGGLLLATMSPAEAALVAVVHHALMGLYFGLMFAPNHKGMPTFEGERRPDFLKSQVLTSRNIRPSPLVDFMFGGLNYQIEHHLFPNMPRNRLKAARPIVRAFCREQGIPYYETSVIRSYSEVLVHLRNVAA